MEQPIASRIKQPRKVIIDVGEVPPPAFLMNRDEAEEIVSVLMGSVVEPR